MARTTKRRFMEVFEREAIALWETSGRMQTEVAAELGIVSTMLGRWQRKLESGAAPASHPRAGGTPVPACTTDSRHYLRIAPNLLARHFVATTPNRIRLADITSIATGEGWIYLAVVLDLATRKIVGRAKQPKVPAMRSIVGMAAEGMRDHMRTELPLAALMMAPQRQRPAPGLICRSDRGSQYAAGVYVDH